MARLLVASIRRFGGALANIPIYSYAPRRGFDIAPSTRAFFDAHGVTAIDEPLNEFSPEYPLANKVFAAAHAEEHLENETLVFLDTDVFVCEEPAEFREFEGADCVLRPVHRKGIGTAGDGDARFAYWRELYERLGGDVRASGRVRSTLDGQTILSYWNAGHIATKRRNSLFRAWKDNFTSLYRSMETDTVGRYYLEQASLAATVTILGLNVREFSNSYNYPLPYLIEDYAHPRRLDRLDDITTAHYHELFRTAGVHHPLRPMLDAGEKSRWLEEATVSFGLLPPPAKRWTRSVARAALPSQVRLSIHRLLGTAGW